MPSTISTVRSWLSSLLSRSRRLPAEDEWVEIDDDVPVNTDLPLDHFLLDVRTGLETYWGYADGEDHRGRACQCRHEYCTARRPGWLVKSGDPVLVARDRKSREITRWIRLPHYKLMTANPIRQELLYSLDTGTTRVLPPLKRASGTQGSMESTHHEHGSTDNELEDGCTLCCMPMRTTSTGALLRLRFTPTAWYNSKTGSTESRLTVTVHLECLKRFTDRGFHLEPRVKITSEDLNEFRSRPGSQVFDDILAGLRAKQRLSPEAGEEADIY